MAKEYTTETLPYYTFYEDEGEKRIEGRYWNPQGQNICVVAVITKGIDWAAYIGASPDTPSEKVALQNVSDWGVKLGEKDAGYFFPEVKLSYRH